MAEPIQIVFCDIDGTLISKATPRMPAALKAALHTLQEKGIKVCTASGRHPIFMEELGIFADFNFDGYVCLNGNLCFVEGQDIFLNTIPAKDVQAALDYVQTRHLPCMFVEKDAMYINFINDAVIQAHAAIHSSLPVCKEISQAASQPILQILPYFEDEKVQEMLESMPFCKAACWHERAYDVIPANGGKRAGIEKMLEHFGLSRRNMMAFGDGCNDMDMLEMAAIGVAMKNAHPQLLQIADYITGSPEENGIVQALEHFCLL